MSLTTSPSVPAAPTPNVLPATTNSQPVPGGTTFVESPKLSDTTEEAENLAAWIVAFKAALASSSTYAALETAVAALQNP